MFILHLPIGGTIDAERYKDPSAPPTMATVHPGSETGAYLQREAGSMANVTVVSLPFCSVDSKDFRSADCALLAQTVLDAQFKANRIVVTAGTDRMAAIGRRLYNNTFGRLKVPVVLTGAFTPIANGPVSDAFDNLRRAAFGLPDLKPGVHIAVGDLVEEAVHTCKDFKRMRFYSVRPALAHQR